MNQRPLVLSFQSRLKTRCQLRHNNRIKLVCLISWARQVGQLRMQRNQMREGRYWPICIIKTDCRAMRDNNKIFMIGEIIHIIYPKWRTRISCSNCNRTVNNYSNRKTRNSVRCLALSLTKKCLTSHLKSHGCPWLVQTMQGGKRTIKLIIRRFLTTTQALSKMYKTITIILKQVVRIWENNAEMDKINYQRAKKESSHHNRVAKI